MTRLLACVRDGRDPRPYVPVLVAANHEPLIRASRCEFEVIIPASYEVVSPNEQVAGTLDGIRYNGARFLTAGSHTFESTSLATGLVLLWSQAVDRGFTPFKPHTLPHG